MGIMSLFGVSLNLDSGYFVEKNGVLFFLTKALTPYFNKLHASKLQ